MKARDGKSLIEVVVVIALLSAVTLVAAQTMHLLLRSEGTGARSLAASTNWARLARQFRRDVRAALNAELLRPAPDDAATRLQLTLPDDRLVLYVPTAEGVVRAVRREAETLAEETFKLSGGDNRFEISPEAGLIVLVHHRRLAYQSPGTKAVQEDTSVAKEFRIEALQGRDHRFTLHPALETEL